MPIRQTQGMIAALLLLGLATPATSCAAPADAVHSALSTASAGTPLDTSKLGPATFQENFSAPVDLWSSRSRPHGRWKAEYDFGWGVSGEGDHVLNDELQCYVDPGIMSLPTPFKIGPLGLEIRATPATAQESKSCFNKPFLSGLLTTSKSFKQAYGYFEIDAKLPAGKGLWPAFWLLEGGSPDEIDILEGLQGNTKELHMTVHYKTKLKPEGKDGAGKAIVVADTSAGFHTYGVLWTRTDLVWYVDKQEVMRTINPSLNKPMFMLLNLAIGGWAGKPDASTGLPAAFAVRRVTVQPLVP